MILINLIDTITEKGVYLEEKHELVWFLITTV